MHGIIWKYINYYLFTRWLHEIDQNCDVVNRILVGNKNDDPDRKVVLSEDARRFAHQMGIQVSTVRIKQRVWWGVWIKIPEALPGDC